MTRANGPSGNLLRLVRADRDDARARHAQLSVLRSGLAPELRLQLDGALDALQSCIGCAEAILTDRIGRR